MESALQEKLVAVCDEYDRLTHAMSKQEVAADHEAYSRHAKASSELLDVVEAFRRFQRQDQDLKEAERILREETDEELRAMAEEEKASLVQSLEELEQELK